MQRLSAVALLVVGVIPAAGETLTGQQIAERIINDSRSAYYASGHPCACPDDHARNGSLCGGRSAYSRPGGAEPKCYPQDVTAADIAAYRAAHSGADEAHQLRTTGTER
jgi:hypothetical protein